MATKQHDHRMEHWLTRLRKENEASRFPADRRDPALCSNSRARTSLTISSTSMSSFLAGCDRESIEPGYALLGLLQILLHRYTFTDEIEVALDVGLVFPVCTEISASMSVRSVLEEAVHAAKEASANGCTWEELQTWTSQAGLPVKRSIFPVLLSTSVLLPRLKDNHLGVDDLNCGQSSLLLAVRPCGRGNCLETEYDSVLYARATIEKILAQFVFLIDSFETLLDQTVDRIPLCSPAEMEGLIQESVAQTQTFPVTQCLQQRFEEQVLKTPDAIAVAMPGDTRKALTYAQLNTSANRLAHYLRMKGVGPDIHVGLYLDRTPDLIIALLAIIKAGGAYLPIDLGYPPERIMFMLSDAAAAVVITDSRTAQNLPTTDAAMIRMDKDAAAWETLSSENPLSNITPDNLAYSIFTSGSTGRPKGVLITHANVCRLFAATQQWFRFSEHDTWTLFHSIAFDFSVWEIWGALLYGGRLIVVPFAESRSPERFYELLAIENVTVLNQTPSAFRQLIGVDERRPNDRLDKLRLVIFGGEALNLQSLAPWFEKHGDVTPQLVNMYGITETTVHVTYRPLKNSDLSEASGSVIGTAISDLELYVLDAGMHPVPIRVPGEMFVGGAGVARGYLKRDDLTAERFVPNPFSKRPGEKLYRSGDLARRLPGGDLEYMGRIDQQVKIRGFRIELGEVQAALARQPNIREAFVIAKDTADGEKILVAYVIPVNGKIPPIDKLRRDLQSILPGYMVPSNFVFLDRLPLTSNGKIDRAALPAVQGRRSEMEQVFNAPQTDLERDIALVYQEVLGLDKVGVDDDFFDLGGDSLRLAEAHSRLQKLVNHNFSAADLFVHTTVRELAASFTRSGSQQSDGKNLLSRAQRQREALSARRNRRR